METNHRNMGGYSPEATGYPRPGGSLIYGSSLSPPPVSSPDVSKQDPMGPSPNRLTPPHVLHLPLVRRKL